MREVLVVFQDVEDPRWDNAKRHDLHETLVVALLTMLTGGRTCINMEDSGREREEWLRQFLTFENGIPSHDTFSRLFRKLDPAGLQKTLLRLAQDWADELGDVVAVDGKALRWSFETASRGPRNPRTLGTGARSPTAPVQRMDETCAIVSREWPLEENEFQRRQPKANTTLPSPDLQDMGNEVVVYILPHEISTEFSIDFSFCFLKQLLRLAFMIQSPPTSPYPSQGNQRHCHTHTVSNQAIAKDDRGNEVPSQVADHADYSTMEQEREVHRQLRPEKEKGHLDLPPLKHPEQ